MGRRPAAAAVLSPWQAELLDWLDANVREIRKQPNLPFGGIQLVFAGGRCTE